MRIHHFIQGEVITASTSNVKTPTMQYDQYGVFVVTHSGTKLASDAAHRIMLQGSLDGTTWFNVDTCSPGDAEYVKSTLVAGTALFSWTKIVQLFPQMRAQFVNGGGLTYNAFLAE